MRLPLGFEAPDAGTVTYDGRELSTLDLREVRRPRILMFDEATSALDNLTQAIVTKASPASSGASPAWSSPTA
jgi:ABC-type bacteriocin/lantibiotic exporter with double-glycine peptidase domain